MFTYIIFYPSSVWHFVILLLLMKNNEITIVFSEACYTVCVVKYADYRSVWIHNKSTKVQITYQSCIRTIYSLDHLDVIIIGVNLISCSSLVVKCERLSESSVSIATRWKYKQVFVSGVETRSQSQKVWCIQDTFSCVSSVCRRTLQYDPACWAL